MVGAIIMEKFYLLCSPLAILLHTCVAMSLTSFNDESALVAFKNHVTFEPTNILSSNWSIKSSVCNWVGVSCNGPRQRVTALSLPNMGLKGTLVPQLGSLSFLTLFNIENNSFYGQIPNEIGHLRQLKLINLRYNQFTGRIPTSLFSISTLESLDLSSNHLHGDIPGEIGNLVAVQHVRLANNQLSGEIPSSLANCGNLRSVDLSSNNFMGKVPSQIGNFPMLTEFLLDSNSLTDNCSVGTSYSDWVGIPCRRVTALNLPEEIETKSKGIAGNAKRASRIIPGRRLLMPLNRQEESKNCHDMGRAEGVATPITKGEEAINAQEYHEPVRAGHSPNPDHSDRDNNSTGGKPPL